MAKTDWRADLTLLLNRGQPGGSQGKHLAIQRFIERLLETHLYREQLLARSIVRLAEASGVKRDHLPNDMTGPMILDLAEETREWVAQMYAQSEVGQEERRPLLERLSTNQSLRPLITLEDAQRIVRQHEEEQDDGCPVGFDGRDADGNDIADLKRRSDV